MLVTPAPEVTATPSAAVAAAGARAVCVGGSVQHRMAEKEVQRKPTSGGVRSLAIRPRLAVVPARTTNRRSISFEHVDGIEIPVIYRNGVKYVSVNIADSKLLARYPNVTSPTVAARRKCSSYYLDPVEATLLNEINMERDFCFGRKCFTTSDVVVQLSSLMGFYEIVRDCVMPNSRDHRWERGGGWLQINDTACPFTWRQQVRWVPHGVAKIAVESAKPAGADGEVRDRERCGSGGEGMMIDGNDDCGSGEQRDAFDLGEVSQISESEVAFFNELCASMGRDYSFDSSTEMISLVDVKLAYNVVVIDLPPSINPFTWGRRLSCVNADELEAIKSDVDAEWEQWSQSQPASGSRAASPSSVGGSSTALSDESVSDTPAARSNKSSADLEHLDAKSSPSKFSSTSAVLEESDKRSVASPMSVSQTESIDLSDRKRKRDQNIEDEARSPAPIEDDETGRRSRSSAGGCETPPSGSDAGKRRAAAEVTADDDAVLESLLTHFPVLEPIVRASDRRAYDPDVLRLIAWFVHVQQRIFEALRRQSLVIDQQEGVDKAVKNQCKEVVDSMLQQPKFWFITKHDVPKRVLTLLHYTMAEVLLHMPEHNLLSFFAGGLFNVRTRADSQHFAFVRSMVIVALTAQGMHRPLPPSSAYQSVEHAKQYLMSCVTAWSSVKCEVLSKMGDVEAWSITLSAVYDRIYGIVPSGAVEAVPVPGPLTLPIVPFSQSDTSLRKRLCEDAAVTAEVPATVELRPVDGLLMACLRRHRSREWWVPVHYAAEVLFPACTHDELLGIARDVARLPLTCVTPTERHRLMVVQASQFGAEASQLPAGPCAVVDVRALHKHIGQLRQWLDRGRTRPPSLTGPLPLSVRGQAAAVDKIEAADARSALAECRPN